MIRLLAMVTCIGVFVVEGTAAVTDDAVSRAAARKIALQELRTEYTRLTGKEPIGRNLLESLKIQNAQDEKAEEVVTSLKLVAFDEVKSDTVVMAILDCYDKNPDAWLIRVACADALLHIDKPRGIGLSSKILDDPKTNLEARLSVAHILAAKKVLIGYPVLREGLTTPNDFQRRALAIPLLDVFFAYDGAVYGEHGERVDVRAILADARKAAKEQKVIDDLKKAELKHNTQPTR